MVKVHPIKISEEIIAEIERIAKELGISKNKLSTLLICNGLVDIKEQMRKFRTIEFHVEVNDVHDQLTNIIQASNKEYELYELAKLKKETEEQREVNQRMHRPGIGHIIDNDILEDIDG